MKVLVTGASGFFGAHVVAAFLCAGWSVAAGMRPASSRERLRAVAGKAALVDIVSLDVTDDVASISRSLAAEAPDVVVHCAAYGVDYGQQELDLAVAVNEEGTARLVEAAAAAGVGRFIHTGTSFEYGNHAGPIDETAAEHPIGIYGTTKRRATKLALERAAALGVALAVVRPFGMYGPGEGAHKLLPQLCRACLEGQALDCTKGEQVRDYTYVGDVARACVRLAEAQHFPAGEVINLGSGRGISLRDLGEMVRRLSGAAEGVLRWGAVPYRQGEVMEHLANPNKAKSLLGWRAKTSLEDGIRLLLAALKGEEDA